MTANNESRFPTAAEAYLELDSLQKQFERVSNPREGGELQWEIGVLYARIGNTARSLKAMEKCAELAHLADDIEMQCNALRARGLLHLHLHRYSEALKSFFDCLRLHNLQQPSSAMARAWKDAGIVYMTMNNPDRALRCFEHGRQIAQSLGEFHLEARLLLRSATALQHLGRLHDALDTALRTLFCFETMGDTPSSVEALTVMGSIDAAMGNHQISLARLQKARALTDCDRPSDVYCKVLVALGLAQEAAGLLTDAMTTLHEALTLAEEQRNMDLLLRLHEALARLYEHADDPSTALKHCKYLIWLREEHHSSRREELITELQILFDVELAEREKELYRAETVKLKEEVATKRRELTSMALSLVQKSEFLQDLKLQLAQALKSSEDPKMTTPLLEELKSESLNGSDWNLFEQQFNEVHRDFMHRLAERHPDLTPMEIKICSLTRMDLSTKDIAELLFRSERNVQNHRYRLRKKLGLKTEESLSTFLVRV